MNLIIVESPTKAKTISRFLSKKYKIDSSYGHIRDLPKSKLGIDVENDFNPHYVIPTNKRKIVNSLKKEAVKSKEIILATDEDREGEAIAWHLIQALNLDSKLKATATPKSVNKKTSKNSKDSATPSKIQRIVFHEITKSAIEKALKNPREININLVNSQQARRALDRLVGYKLSPFLWKKIVGGLSAGRVQSVALRLIVQREEEIRRFKPEIYFTINASFRTKNNAGLDAELVKINDSPLVRPGISTKTETDQIIANLKKCDFRISFYQNKKTHRQPLPPFITSTLQQEASKRLRFSAKQTMRLAQNLYENGFITYMRTDSFNLSRESTASAKKWLEKNLGAKYASEAPRIFKAKSRLAQEAHEAVRPTDPGLLTEQINVGSSEKKLYDLIWRRFIGSQMPKAILNTTRVEIQAKNPTIKDHYLFVASGSTLLFDGFLKIWPMKISENLLPPLDQNEILNLKEIQANKHQTQPPARYNEAQLIKTLEKYDIGRPSTYAPIISVIQERNYVIKNHERRFEPSEIGELVNQVLVKHFPDIVDIAFTAEMETKLDKIAQGQIAWQSVLREFYEPFSRHLEQKYIEVEKQTIAEPTDEICEKCGQPMAIKLGRFGKFLACQGFPKCTNTKKINNYQSLKNKQGEEIRCPECQEGIILQKKTRKNKMFFGCSRYPACKFASWKKPEEK